MPEMCTCPNPGPSQAALCLSNKQDVPFVSTRWCDCKCHKRVSAEAEAADPPVPSGYLAAAPPFEAVPFDVRMGQIPAPDKPTLQDAVQRAMSVLSAIRDTSSDPMSRSTAQSAFQLLQTAVMMDQAAKAREATPPGPQPLTEAFREAADIEAATPVGTHGKTHALDVDFEKVRSLHRIVRAMHDGECPKCHVIVPATDMRKPFIVAQGDGHRWEEETMHCPECHFSISGEEQKQVFRLFGPVMEKNLAIFEERQ